MGINDVAAHLVPLEEVKTRICIPECVYDWA